MDSYQKAFYAAASLADLHKFNVRTGARTLALSASLADVEKAKAELQRQQRAAKEKIAAVISDCYHQNEGVISTTRLHLLTKLDVQTIIDIAPLVCDPVAKGRIDFWAVHTARELVY
jgi:hypothetical protein